MNQRELNGLIANWLAAELALQRWARPGGGGGPCPRLCSWEAKGHSCNPPRTAHLGPTVSPLRFPAWGAPGPVQPLQGGVPVAAHRGVAENPQRGASRQAVSSHCSHCTEGLLQQNL